MLISSNVCLILDGKNFGILEQKVQVKCDFAKTEVGLFSRVESVSL